ncbi:hypothetical protein RB601_000664 [Gaeumannomyces tritici]
MRASGIFYALFAALRVSAQAVAAAPGAPSDLQVQGSYIVELETDGKMADFYQTLSSTHGIKTKQRMTLGSSKIFNGASFKALDAAGLDDAKLMNLIAATPAVRRVWPVRKVTLNIPKTEDVANHTAPAHAPGLRRRQDAPLDVDPKLSGDHFMPHLMTQIDKLHAKNITGKGFKIAMMDSGIDYTHPALGGCFGPGCLVEGGWDFVGDPPAGGEPQPDADPYDGCHGHGTHVAGTIAAQAKGNKYGFTGAAPDVKLWAYRTWNCASSGSNEILVAAFVRAYEDGADILQCSNGIYDNGGWEDEPWAHVAGRIAQTGVPVIISAGNSGGRGLFSASTPASGRGVQAVASVQNRMNPGFVSRGTYRTDAGSSKSRNQSATGETYGFYAGSPWPEETVTLPLWSIGNDTTSENDACSPLPDSTPDLSNKLVLLRVPGTRKCFPQDQGKNILAKGGKYIAYYAFSNNTWDAQFVYVDGIKGVTSVSPAQGAAWIEMLGPGFQVNVTIPKKADAPENMLLELEDNETGGCASSFTSWGPNWDLEPYPHVAAPGGHILSLYPVVMGSYRVMSGTSMASPLVAGLVALMGEARGGKLDGDLFGRIMSSTAKPLTWFDGKKASPGTLAPPAQGGAGLVQAYDAVFAKTVLDRRNIALNDSAHFVPDHEFTIQNVGPEEATYEVGHLRSLTMYTTVSTPAGDLPAGVPNPIADGAWAELTFSPETVTVPAGGSAKVKVTVAPPAAREGLNASRLPVYGGYVSVNSTRAEHLVMPYLGVVGSIHDKPVLLAGASYLANFGSPVPANTSYTLPPPDPKNQPSQRNDDGRFPNMLLTMGLGTRVLHVHVASLSDPARNRARTPTGVACVGEVAGAPLRFIANFSQRAYLSGLLNDGSILPAGSYKMVASALRIFGDESVPVDWDVVETVPFSIQYSGGTAAR